MSGRSGAVADPAAIERELSALWRGADDAEPVTRACALNLIVVCDDGEDDARIATGIVARVAESEPGRALLVVQPGGDGDELDVRVSANCHRDGNDRVVCSEQIELRFRGDGTALVPQTALQLLVEDMPVYVWWRRRRMRRDPLLYPMRALADRLIVDSARFSAPVHGLHVLRAVAGDPDWAGQVLDLAWLRQEPWREAIASMFDQPARRRALDDVRRVRIVAGGPFTPAGGSTAGAFVVGWLASRLGWRRSEGRWIDRRGRRILLEFARDEDLGEGEIHSVSIEAELDGRPFQAGAERTDRGGSLVRVACDSTEPKTIGLPARDDAAVLCGTLQRGPRDPVFVDALRAAAETAES